MNIETIIYTVGLFILAVRSINQQVELKRLRKGLENHKGHIEQTDVLARATREAVVRSVPGVAIEKNRRYEDVLSRGGNVNGIPQYDVRLDGDKNNAMHQLVRERVETNKKNATANKTGKKGKKATK